MKRSSRPSLSTSTNPTPHPRYGTERGREARGGSVTSAKSPFALIAIERRVVLGEVGLDEIEPAVAVVVAGVDAHSCLLAAVAAHGDAGLQPRSTNVPSR